MNPAVSPISMNRTVRPIVRLALFAASSALALAGSHTVLLLDATRIERTENIRIEVGRVEKSPHNPLFGADRPWESRIDNMYPNIVHDERMGIYRCWYNPFFVEVEDWNGSTPERKRWLYLRDSGLCYAESPDGIHWTKPKYDILTFRGELSNIVARDIHGIGVFLDHHESDPARRYKMIFVNQAHGVRSTMGVAFSPDGIHWGPQTVLENVNVMADTHNNALWAPTLNRYVAFTRDWDPRKWKRDSQGNIPAVRLVSRIESPDFLHWSDPQEVLRGLSPNLQTYGMLVFFHAGLYIGMPVIYDIQSGRVFTELAWSKDTVTWHRVEPGTPFIPNGAPGTFDWGCIYPAAYPLIGPKEIRIYYSGSNDTHSATARGSFLEFATMRPDGFAAATPADRGRNGKVVTAPLTIPAGGVVSLTADVEDGGMLEVALLGRDGRELTRSRRMTGSFTARPVEWQAPNAAFGDGVRLSFTLSRCHLYSYQTEDVAGSPR